MVYCVALYLFIFCIINHYSVSHMLYSFESISTQREFKVRTDYMTIQEITERMRNILIDWLVQVHLRFNLLQETLFLTIQILDRYLEV